MDALKREEAQAAMDKVMATWPREDARELLGLTGAEIELVLELVARFDAVPESAAPPVDAVPDRLRLVRSGRR